MYYAFSAFSTILIIGMLHSIPHQENEIMGVDIKCCNKFGCVAIILQSQEN